MPQYLQKQPILGTMTLLSLLYPTYETKFWFAWRCKCCVSDYDFYSVASDNQLISLVFISKSRNYDFFCGFIYIKTQSLQFLHNTGRIHGCHSCGKRWRTTFVGDHIPPNMLVKDGQKQRFYPQCRNCSYQQGKITYLWWWPYGMQKCASLELLFHFFYVWAQTLQDGRTLYSIKSNVFCFSILTVFGGKMMSL